MPDPTSTSSRDDVRHFHVHTCLGSGGFGDVYRATMISPGGVRHEVAVKVLHEGLDPSSQAVQRLRDEGRMLGVLRHPAILRVHDLVILAGRVALVTEFIDGGDLDRCFKAGDMTLRPLVEIIGQVAAALDAAWAHPAPGGGELHLVHRDVKPANIRVGRHGEVKLLDFGIAKAAGVKREARTEAKTVVGSYLYMSPERLMRKDSSGPQGDVYSLGAVLYEGLARRRLFAGVDLKDQLLMARDHRRHDRFVKDALEALHAVDPRARELALTCLYLEPAKRPTAAQIAHRCEELADDLPGANLRQWSRKRNWPTASSETGELGGRTLTESTIITDTLPADALATPAPPPKHGTMVEFLASEAPTADRSAHTTDSLDDLGSIHEPAPPPVPKKLDIKTKIHPDPPTVPFQRPQQPSPDSLAPTQLILDAPEKPQGRRWWLWGLGLVALVGLVVILATASGVGTVLLFQMSETPAAPAPTPEVTPQPVEGTNEPAPEPDPEPQTRPTPRPAPAPAPEAAPDPAPIPIEVAPAPAPKPAPTAVVIPPIEEPAPEPGQPGDGWGEDGSAVPTEAPPEPEAVQPSTGTVRIDGRVPVQLRGQGQTHQPGDVPIGTWEIWADFGQGMTRASNSLLNVEAGGSYTIKCSALRLQCTTLGG